MFFERTHNASLSRGARRAMESVYNPTVASFQTKLLTFVVKLLIKPRLTAAKDALEVRKVFGRTLYSAPDEVTITAAEVGGVKGEWVTAKGAPPSSNRVLLFLHGGGYIACTEKTHRPYSCFFAQAGFRVFMPAYRLAPEHPFPAGLDDAVAVYRALRNANPGASMVIGGDSAGGGLTLATLLRLHAEGDSLPAAAALFSPLTDLTGASPSWVTNSERCAMFRNEGLHKVAGFYAQGQDLKNPLLSPVYGDYQGFPPMLIHVGEDETLRDDSVRLAENLRKANVAVDLQVWPVVPHDWQLLYRMSPEGRESLQQAAAFLVRHTV